MDITFFGGIVVLIAALYLIFWLFDKLRKEKPPQETRGSIDTLCSFGCAVISGGPPGGGALGLQGVALLAAGSVLVLTSFFSRAACKKPAAPEE